MSESYYSILEVSETSTPEEIKKSYRRLSMEYHPDKNRNPDATAKFQKISEAYETLSDVDKKRQYDMTRKNPFLNGTAGGVPVDLENMFANMFGFGIPFAHMNSFGQQHGNGQPFVQVFHNGRPVNMNFGAKPTPIIKNILITIEQVLTGTKMPVEIERWIATDANTKTTEKETIYVDIPKGIDDGEMFILPEKGNIMENGTKGDLKIFVKVENNTEFKRRGLDLILEKTITLKESLCGFAFDIKYITGKIYTITNPSGNVINPGHNKIIPSMGLTRENTTGNLIILFNIKFPEKLTQEVVTSLSQVDF